MKTGRRIFVFFLLLMIFFNGLAQKTYTLISKKNGQLNTKLIAGLPASLKGLAALYSAMGGTNCLNQQCALTTALGLGSQGSEEQKQLILKYFPNDPAAKLVVSQDCYQQPTTSSSFSNFIYLSFIVTGSSVQVNYELDVLSPAGIKKIKGPDIYQLKDQVYTNKKRVLYAWTAKS